MNLLLSLRKAILILCMCPMLWAAAQETTFPTNGVDDYRTGTYAFTNATIYMDYKTVLKNATLVIEKGKVKAIGTAVSIPANAVVQDLNGKYIYPSFIDLNSQYGLDKAKSSHNWDAAPKMISDKKGAYGWNKAVKPEVNAHTAFGVNNGEAENLRKNGFGVVLTHYQDGIVRGTGTVVSLQNARENAVILKDKATAHYSFNKGTSDQDYPSSLMGVIALLRQTYMDADWYKKNIGSGKIEYNISLDQFNQNQSLPQIIEVAERFDILRANKIATEFGKKYICKGNGDEYARVNEVKATGSALIIPVNFPKPYDVTDPIDALTLDYASMKNWEMAPSNPSMLHQAGIQFAFTASGLEKMEDLFTNLRKAIKRGLPDSIALMNLTSTPAALINMSDKIGSLHTGKLANFIICSKPVFDEKNMIFQNWVQGEKYMINAYKDAPINAEYKLSIGAESYTATVSTKDNVYALSFKNYITAPKVDSILKKEMAINKDTAKTKTDTLTIKAKLVVNKNLVTITFNPDPKKEANTYRLSGTKSDALWTGTGELPSGKFAIWKMTYLKEVPDTTKEKPAKKDTSDAIGRVIYPFTSFGSEKINTVSNVLIKNATVWSNEASGIMKNTDVHIANGKIVAVGSNISVAGAEIIDGKDKHITSGIIDEHSHIAITRGVNEGTQASSAEVRIGDVVTGEDVNIYRQLAGGVIGSQLLHGSANPIGGQSAMIKLRWGHTPENMKVQGADGFIKFALGENVKQSNWGDKASVRFPQTRMGVEQVYINYFTKAREYARNIQLKPTETRRDLEMDALNEILIKERFITCHSYVQSEINMLMHVADSFGFMVNTFTHILEGYKVADKMKAHGVSASTFSDWWAYKYEVIDAIPHNASILQKMGVTTAINSDDAEMGRRLNQEAAKSVKYGGMSEEEAWKMVTLNPCKMLHLDHHMGSVKVGKDADIVLWNDHPLSIYAKPLQTYVDGVKYFDANDHKKIRLNQSQDRARLIQKMLKEKDGGAATQKVVPKVEEEWNCGHEHLD
jgi:imidazolonepropionase-like amidohydrolase